MAGAQTPEQVDAIYRARAEIRLLVGRYERRLKTLAEQKALVKMLASPSTDPEEAGRAAFAEAGVELGLITNEATPALTAPTA